MNLVRYLSMPHYAYFRNHCTSGRRAYFRLSGQLSQVCAESVHIFAYYPRMPRVCDNGQVLYRKAVLLRSSKYFRQWSVPRVFFNSRYAYTRTKINARNSNTH
mgnify:CR=1 FL=1